MSHFEYTDDETYPVEASAGGNNMHYIACDAVGWRPNYAVCLNKIAARKAGRASEVIGGDCCRAIDNGTCSALAMQKEEATAGKALYFVNRVKWLAQHEAWIAEQPWSLENQRAIRDRQVVTHRPSAVYKMSEEERRRLQEAQQETWAKKPHQSTPRSKPVAVTHDDGNDFAAAINAALQETAQEKPAPAAPAALAGAKPGMSLIELARLRLAQQGAEA